MGVWFCSTTRIFLSRSFPQRHHGLSSLRKRPISSSPQKPSAFKQEGKSATSFFLSRRLSLPYQVICVYGRAQKERPWITQLCSVMVIWCCGDLLAQGIGDEDYDPWRTLRHSTIGCIVAIPNYMCKFMYLGRSFNSSSKIGSLAAKVLVNQIAFAPVFAVYFFGMQSLLAGGSLVDYWERIKNTVPTSFIKSCKLWPAVTAFNFTFIPAQSRPLFAGLVAVAWQSYLSWLNQEGAKRKRLEALEL